MPEYQHVLLLVKSSPNSSFQHLGRARTSRLSLSYCGALCEHTHSHLCALPWNPLSTQRTPAAAWPPSSRGHLASGELASCLRRRLRIWGPDRLQDQSPLDPREDAGLLRLPHPPHLGAVEDQERRGAARGRRSAGAASLKASGTGARRRGRVSGQSPATPREGPQLGWKTAQTSCRDAGRGSWSGPAPAPGGRSCSGTRIAWKRGWMITGTLPSLTLLGKPPGKKRTPGRPTRGAESDLGAHLSPLLNIPLPLPLNNLCSQALCFLSRSLVLLGCKDLDFMASTVEKPKCGIRSNLLTKFKYRNVHADAPRPSPIHIPRLPCYSLGA